MKTLVKTSKKVMDKIKEVAKILFTGVFGKILIVPIAVGYYFTDNTLIQLLILSILFSCVRLNFHGFRLMNVIKKPKIMKDSKVIYINSLAKE